MSEKDYKAEGIHLMRGDCLERMQEIESGSVNLVLTSPPYNMNLRIRNGKYCSRQITTNEFTTKYENFSDNLPMDEYFKFNKRVITECLRVSDLVFYNVQILTGNKPALFKLMGEFHEKLKELIVWDKVNAQPAIGGNVLNSGFELILVFQNSAPESRAFHTAGFDRGTLSNVWRIPRGKKVSKNHGAVFPIDLAAMVIQNFSKEGDIVCDPFTGTGTVPVACLNLNRRFVGAEIGNSYFKFTKERVKNHNLAFTAGF